MEFPFSLERDFDSESKAKYKLVIKPAEIRGFKNTYMFTHEEKIEFIQLKDINLSSTFYLQDYGF